jgi:hypothetical protein
MMVKKSAEICIRCNGIGNTIKNTIIINCKYCNGEGLINTIKCVNYDCKLANTCYRMISDIDNHWQAYYHYYDKDCKNYIKATEDDIQKAMQTNILNTRGELSRHKLVVRHGRNENRRELL